VDEGVAKIYCVYVLQSQKNDKKYVGYTQKVPNQRLAEHNQGSNTWTRHNGPFDLIHQESFSSKHAAVKKEIYLKSAAGRRCIKKILRS